MNQVFNSMSNEFESIEDVHQLNDWNLKKAFIEWRHTLVPEKLIENKQEVSRVKERLKTVSVALVLCLNVGVEPPDVIKPSPAAKTECWVDPFTMPPDKALDAISNNLIKQYEKYHPKARYKIAPDLKLDDVKKLCISLRRNAKDDRVLFHYNGHGVPKPTVNGEIWVFNKDYTQYLPLSIYDLQTWMGPNSVYVFDCSAAGEIIKNFKNFIMQRKQEYEFIINQQSILNGYNLTTLPLNFNNCIQFGACASDQILPMNPELPADLFTSCLTTPIKISLKYYLLQNHNRLLPEITDEMIDKIPGLFTDRRTMFGELNWILTAVVDTIAWDILPKETFQKMFRQDLLVSLLSRHFILAQRIMSSYECTPVSSPEIPAAPRHPMWSTWDYILDQCLLQLKGILEKPNQIEYVHSTFFTEQLTAFQMWLLYGLRVQNDIKPKVEQLPVVLQVLLSHVHRLRALELLSKFLSLGDWAVDMALSVGIFPYVLKLLQSPDRKLRPLLVYIWAKIFSLDGTAQNDLIYDNAYKYFLKVLSDTNIISDYRLMAAFVMACFVRDFYKGQELAFKENLIAICLEQLNDQNSFLRQWLCLCLGLTWNNHIEARWCGVRDIAHEKLFVLLSDPVPDVRASAVFALGTFINSEKTDHASTIDDAIGIKLIATVGNDGSPLVRKELIAALQWLVLLFENRFVAVAYQMQEEEKKKNGNKDDYSHLSPTGNTDLTPPSNNLMKRVSSSNSLSTFNSSSFQFTGGIENVYITIWKQLLALSNDPHHDVAQLANIVIDKIRNRIMSTSTLVNHTITDSIRESKSDPSFSEPSSPITNSYLSDSMQQQKSSNRKDRDSSEFVSTGTLNKKERQSSDTILNSNSSSNSNSISNSLGQNRERQTSEGSNGPNFNRLNTNKHTQLITLTPYQRKRTMFGKEPDPDKIRVNRNSNNYEKEDERKSLVETHFIDSCVKYFNDYPFKLSEELDMESEYNQKREWKIAQINAFRKSAKEEYCRIDASKTEEKIFIQRNNHLPRLLQFHPYEPYLIVAEKESFSVWNWEKTSNPFIGTYLNYNLANTKITSMQMINPTEMAEVMFACDDGSVRLWKLHDIYQDVFIKPKIMTAFNIFNKSSVMKCSGTLIHWEQNNLNLLAAGDFKTIRIWDATKEMKKRDIITGSDTPPVTSLHSDNKNFICAGCYDGSLRIFDRRLQGSESRVITFRDHDSQIINAHLYPEEDKHVHIISGSASGDIKLWDKRLSTRCIKKIQIPGNTSMVAMSVHPEADVFACATSANTIHIYSIDGIPGSIIKYHDSFITQQLGPISCLTHHPLKVNLALGCTDSIIKIYTSTKGF